MQRLNLHRLQIFCTVYELNSVSAAGRALRLSQPTVSRHLAIFEDELGFKLFGLLSGRLNPTREAQRLYAESGGFFERLDRVEESIESIRRGANESLRIIASTAMSHAILPNAIGELFRKMPNLNIKVDAGAQTAQVEALREGSADVAVGGRQQNFQDLRQTVLGKIPMVALVPVEDPRAENDVFDISWLETWECVMHNRKSPIGAKIEGMLTELGIQPTRHISAHSIAFSIGIAAQAGLCALVDRAMAAQSLSNKLKIMPLSHDLNLELAILENANQADRKSLALFRSAMKKAFSAEKNSWNVVKNSQIPHSS